MDKTAPDNTLSSAPDFYNWMPSTVEVLASLLAF